MLYSQNMPRFVGITLITSDKAVIQNTTITFIPLSLKLPPINFWVKQVKIKLSSWTTIISYKRMAEKRWSPSILELTIRRKWVVRVTYWTETSSPTGGVKAAVQKQCPVPEAQPVPSSSITELSLFILNEQSFKLVRHAHLLETKLDAMFQNPLKVVVTTKLQLPSYPWFVFSSYSYSYYIIIILIIIIILLLRWHYSPMPTFASLMDFSHSARFFTSRSSLSFWI